MATAILHGGPGDNTVLQVNGEPSEIQFQVVVNSVAPTPILPKTKAVVHPAPQPTTQLEKVVVMMYYKCRKVVPDGNLHYLDEPDYKALLASRGGL